MPKQSMQCTNFRCFRHGDRRCCAGCREPCEHICLNGPERCGLVQSGPQFPPPGKRQSSLTPEKEAELTRLAADGIPPGKAQHLLDLPQVTVYRWYKAHGYKPRRQLTEELRQRICEMYAEGKSLYAIANELERPYNTIAYHARQMRLKEGRVKPDEQ